METPQVDLQKAETPQTEDQTAAEENQAKGKLPQTQSKRKSVAREYTEAIIIAVLLALFIRTFIVQAFKIPSGSMLETLQIGDHVLVNKFIYGIKMPCIDKEYILWLPFIRQSYSDKAYILDIPFTNNDLIFRNPFNGQVLIPIKEPKRGDIIVFKFPQDPSVDYIKRVVAVGGDTIEIKNKKVFVNGELQVNTHAKFTDPEIKPAIEGPRDNYAPQTVPPGKLFVMGDNRDNSFDSRFWGFVDLNAVRGKAFILYWSWDVRDSLFSIDRFTSIRWSRIGHLVE